MLSQGYPGNLGFSQRFLTHPCRGMLCCSSCLQSTSSGSSDASCRTRWRGFLCDALAPKPRQKAQETSAVSFQPWPPPPPLGPPAMLAKSHPVSHFYLRITCGVENPRSPSLFSQPAPASSDASDSAPVHLLRDLA